MLSDSFLWKTLQLSWRKIAEMEAVFFDRERGVLFLLIISCNGAEATFIDSCGLQEASRHLGTYFVQAG